MNALVFVLGLAVAWLVIGLATGVVMARRGHDFRTWFGLGAIAGPLVVRLIADAEPTGPGTDEMTKRGFAGTGPVDVLVGIDGSPESFRALTDVAELFGPRLGRVTVAAVIDAEARPSHSPDDDHLRAEGHLRAAVEYLASVEITPTTRVLTGRPAHELERHAVEEGFDLVAVGPRGEGLSSRVLGSVAEHLLRRNQRPILVASSDS